QFPSAALHAADPRRRVRRPGSRSPRLSRSRRAQVPVLQLRRRDAHTLIFSILDWGSDSPPTSVFFRPSKIQNLKSKMEKHFTVLQSDPASRARLGRLMTAHGEIETPCFMPVGTQG